MAYKLFNRVLETSTTTGAGTYTLSGAIAGYRALSTVSGLAVGDTFPYYAEEVDASGLPTGGFEAGLGQVLSGLTTFTRLLVDDSSNAGAPVSWATGTRRIGIGLTARDANAILPVGSVALLSPSSVDTAKWKLCDGSYYARTSFPLATMFPDKYTSIARGPQNRSSSVYGFNSAYGAGIHVQAETGGGGWIWSSTDAIYWRRRQSIDFINPSVIFALGLFIVMAQSSATYYTSPDGVTWTARTFPIAPGGRVFLSANGTTVVAIINTSLNTYTSTDGINWTLRNGALPSTTLGPVAWNGTVFATVNLTAGTAGATSTDGITWTARTVTNGAWLGIAWNGTTFAAVGSTSTFAMTSTDGITWTAQTIGGACNSVVWDATIGLFAASLNSNSVNCYTSPTGVTWTLRTLSPTSLTSSRICGSGAGKFVAEGITIGALIFSFVSTDGITWTQYIASDNSPQAVGNAATGFIVTTRGFGTALSTDGGVTWSYGDMPPTSGTTVLTNFAIYGGGNYAAIRYNTPSTAAYSSTDGLSWTQQTLPSSQNWSNLCWTGSNFVATSTSTTAATSPTGVTWTQRTLINNTTSTSGLASNGAGVVIAAGAGAGIASRSTDHGVTWSNLATLNLTATNIAYNSTLGIFAALSPSGSASISTDNGVTWSTPTAAPNGVTLAANSITSLGAAGFMAVTTTSASLYVSKDGINWVVIGSSAVTASGRSAFDGTYAVTIASAAAVNSNVIDSTQFQVPPITSPYSANIPGSGMVAYYNRVA